MSNDEVPAFPQTYYFADGSPYPQDGDQRGMSLRDYFAAKALQGMLAATKEDYPWPGADQYARLAHEYADAMLKAREPQAAVSVDAPDNAEAKSK